MDQKFRKGVGGRGLATATKGPQNYVPSQREERKNGAEKGLNLWYCRDFLAPSPAVRQPLIETFEWRKFRSVPRLYPLRSLALYFV